MPKDRRSSSLERCRASPYSHCYKNPNKTKPKSPSQPIGNETEWEETRCPICIDHPHNAVLLLCSSREKGCRPYMCDTSSRHSNCLDQFRKSTNHLDSLQQKTNLVCPLCRGQITGWVVIDPARHFMNKKPRSCSSPSCDFSGNYTDLRRHARRDHPCVRPTRVNPEQELEWRNLGEDMEQQDMMSMQFEFDDGDDDDDHEPMEQVLDGLYELASPIWDYDLDFMNFLSSFESEFDSVFPEYESNNLFMDDWDNMFSVSSSSRVTTRSRSNNRRPRARANRSIPNSDNHQVLTTLVDFHELGSNMP